MNPSTPDPSSETCNGAPSRILPKLRDAQFGEMCDGLPAERREQLLEQCAGWVVRKGLEAPVLMFLEMHKPLLTLAAVSYAMSQPMLMLFFGFRRTEELRLLLSERNNVEALMQRIELRAKEEAAPRPRTPKGEA